VFEPWGKWVPREHFRGSPEGSRANEQHR
jgi:hypothetical protein